MKNEHKCEVLPPHQAAQHEKIARAIKANPSQKFVVEGDLVYLVDDEDFIAELTKGDK